MVFDKVAEIVAREMNVDKSTIKMETDLGADLGADSLDAVELMMALEDEFELEIADEEAQNFKTVADIVNYLDKV